MLSEINFLHLGVISELFRSARSKNGSVIDDISAVRDLQGFSDIVISDKNPNLLGFQVVYDLLDLKHRNGIDSRKRLVPQNKIRGKHQRSRYLHSTPLAPPQSIPPAFFVVG